MTRRRARLTLGLAIAGSLWFGLVLAFVRLHMSHHLFIGNVDSRLVDVGMLALNAALLVSFVTVHRSRRSRQPGGQDEAEE